ncbi:hypothetical protein ACKVMT_00285 [Halobacteriales archaeon Cl-PHB]
MNHLSACYFCGIALDEPLADYPVVPADLHSEGERHTVTLCPSCHQKLDTVMDVVTEAVEGSPDLDLGAVPDEEATSVEEASPDTRTPSTDAMPSASAGDDPGTAADPTEGDAEPAATETLSTDDEADESLTSAMEAEVPKEFEADSTDETAAAEPAADSDPLDFDAAPAEEELGTGEASPEPETAADEADTEQQEGSTDGEETEPSDSGRSDPAEVVSDAGASISALEYNKVMRLLQNREFPVERDEIETVAANAYGLARADCAQVIDLAIDRDLLGERDGQLVRPD